MLFAKVVAGAVATGVTVALALRIRTYMLNSDLENAVGGSSALKRAGGKAMLANKAMANIKARRKLSSIDAGRRRPSREGADGGYLAFVSHMKAEAAMEARFLQIELEAISSKEGDDEIVFLDSDDLRDLSKLITHVRQSRALILVLTRKVLTRPYCIIEVLTAIESRIPIVCVTVAGKPNDAYNFEEMSQMMQWMDSELEQWNPGASDVLRDHGYDDLEDVAYRLSTVVPKTIAVTLNTGASRNMLRATIEDVVAAIDEARERLTENGGKGRDVPDKATWLAQREKMTRPPTGVAKGERARNPLQRAQTASLPVVHAHGATAEAYPVVGEPNATAVAPAVAPVAAAPAVAPLAGQRLIAAAGTNPALLPLAFAVQALSSGGKNAAVQQRECSNVAAAAEPLERLLLAAASGAEAPMLEAVHGAVEALAAMQARCGAKAAASLDAEALVKLGPAAFEAATAKLISAVGQLCASASSSSGARVAAADLAKALQGLPVTAPPPPAPPPPAPPAVDASITDALSASQAQAEAARQQRELLEMQNKVLMEQVAQMQQMMAQQQMSMQSFMAKFPQPPDEAERRLVLLKKRLMDAPRSDFVKIDDLLRNMVISGALGPDCHVAMFNVIGEHEQRGLSMCLALDDGRMLTYEDLPMMAEERTARKASMCQYVVATGEYQCMRKQDATLADGQSCFMMEFMKKGVNIMQTDPKMHEFVESMRQVDPYFDENLGKMAMMTPLMATDAEIQDMPTMRRLSTKMQRAIIKGALRAASGTAMGDFMTWMSTTFAAEDTMYIGAPVRCEGRVMGSLCGLFSPKSGTPGDEIKAKLERAASRLTDVLEAL